LTPTPNTPATGSGPYAPTLLAAVDSGRQLNQFVTFRTDWATHDLPATLTVLVDDVTARATKIRDHFPVRLIECAGAPLATLIARDPKLRSLGSLVGDHYLAVPIEHEEEFRRTVRTLGRIVTAATG
jgi:hypothetical protein